MCKITYRFQKGLRTALVLFSFLNLEYLLYLNIFGVGVRFVSEAVRYWLCERGRAPAQL